MSVPVLEIRNLHVDFKTRHGVLHALNGISFSIARGDWTVSSAARVRLHLCLSYRAIFPPAPFPSAARRLSLHVLGSRRLLS